jgi:imidazolonepropionase-like amidohydrolase
MKAITGAKIYTISDGVIEKGTILIEDGKFTKVGARVKIPSDAEVSKDTIGC